MYIKRVDSLLKLLLPRAEVDFDCLAEVKANLHTAVHTVKVCGHVVGLWENIGFWPLFVFGQKGNNLVCWGKK